MSSYRKRRIIRNNIAWWIFFILGHSYGKFMEKKCLKALSYCCAPFWTYNFSICLWQNPQSPHYHFYDFGISERVLEPQNHIIYLCWLQDTSNGSWNSPYYFLKILGFASLRTTGTFWKRRAPKHPDDPSNKILKVLDMGAVSSRKHEMEIW